MTQVAKAPDFGLTAPSSRQDVVSAILDGYGYSFEDGDESPYAFPPVPDLKELPPPPPASNTEPLLSGMSMRFQLRVEDPNPYDSRRKNSIESPTKIVYRSISRSAKPRSLNLLASNGSTAVVPPTPAPVVPAKQESFVSASSLPIYERPLPPPPPAKSIRRKSIRRAEAAMGNQASKMQGDAGKEKMKRKPLPGSSIGKKFASLADLGKGPRGKSTAPKTSTSNDESASASASNADEGSRETIRPPTALHAVPTDREDLPLEKTTQGHIAPPPHKAYASLPSNPRGSKSTTTASTGLDATRGTIQAGPQQPQSPVSPTYSSDYEARPGTQKQHHQVQLGLEPFPSLHSPPLSPVTANVNTSRPAPTYPPRTTSRPALSPLASPERGFVPPTDDSASFVPLTRAPVSLPPLPITQKHIKCYTNHASFSESTQRFQRSACQVCGVDGLGVRCTCAWCLINLCLDCRNELRQLPGRSLLELMEKKRRELAEEKREKEESKERGMTSPMGLPSLVIWEEDEEDGGQI